MPPPLGSLCWILAVGTWAVVGPMQAAPEPSGQAMALAQIATAETAPVDVVELADWVDAAPEGFLRDYLLGHLVEAALRAGNLPTARAALARLPRPPVAPDPVGDLYRRLELAQRLMRAGELEAAEAILQSWPLGHALQPSLPPGTVAEPATRDWLEALFAGRIATAGADGLLRPAWFETYARLALQRQQPELAAILARVAATAPQLPPSQSADLRQIWQFATGEADWPVAPNPPDWRTFAPATLPRVRVAHRGQPPVRGVLVAVTAEAVVIEEILPEGSRWVHLPKTNHKALRFDEAEVRTRPALDQLNLVAQLGPEVPVDWAVVMAALAEGAGPAATLGMLEELGRAEPQLLSAWPERVTSAEVAAVFAADRRGLVWQPAFHRWAAQALAETAPQEAARHAAFATVFAQEGPMLP